MNLTLEEFINKWLGKPADYDGVWDGQCVDLYRFYCKEVLGIPQSVPVGGAAEIWDTASTEYFDFILNDPYAVPQRGDIIIWDRNVGDGFGHVAVYLEGNVNSFISLDQNWPTLSEVTKTKHNYNHVIGWLRPKNVYSSNLAECLKQHTKLVEEAGEKDKLIASQAQQIKNLEKEKANLDKKIKEWIEKYVRADALRQKWYSTYETKASLLKSCETDRSLFQGQATKYKKESVTGAESSVLVKELVARMFKIKK